MKIIVKTAALFSASTKVGAILANKENKVKELLYQIRIDYLFIMLNNEDLSSMFQIPLKGLKFVVQQYIIGMNR